MRALATFDQPDAGPWELRNSRSVHTFSAVMCWAALDRLARIADVGLRAANGSAGPPSPLLRTCVAKIAGACWATGRC